jgi:uncharacterized protein YdhG (YjbR/CyaY superfamily)
MEMKRPSTVDEYIAQFSPQTQRTLQQVRALIKKTAPDAEEVISYAMPGYKWNGMLVWFAGYGHHLGFYPMPSALTAFKSELSKYKSSKGAVQFPLDQKMPVALITKIIKYRMEENLMKAQLLKATLKKKK